MVLFMRHNTTKVVHMAQYIKQETRPIVFCDYASHSMSHLIHTSHSMSHLIHASHSMCHLIHASHSMCHLIHASHSMCFGGTQLLPLETMATLISLTVASVTMASHGGVSVSAALYNSVWVIPSFTQNLARKGHHSSWAHFFLLKPLCVRFLFDTDTGSYN